MSKRKFKFVILLYEDFDRRTKPIGFAELMEVNEYYPSGYARCKVKFLVSRDVSEAVIPTNQIPANSRSGFNMN